jgi:hypothetical protein
MQKLQQLVCFVQHSHTAHKEALSARKACCDFHGYLHSLMGAQHTSVGPDGTMRHPTSHVQLPTFTNPPRQRDKGRGCQVDVHSMCKHTHIQHIAHRSH